MIKKQPIPGVKLSQVPQHSYVEFPGEGENAVFFNSKFDSGNLKKVVKNGYDHYSIWTASDAEGTPYEGYPKSWFYFQTGGWRRKKITFSVHRVHFLWAMASKKQLYRPVYRVKQKTNNQTDQIVVSNWQRLPHPIISLAVNGDQQLVLKFDFFFSENIKSVQFAFIYPYSHQQCRKDVLELQNVYQNDPQIFLRQYQLCKSIEGRIVDMLVISSHQGKQGFENIKTDQIFTLGGSKMTKFRNNKPIIFISSRVHPIQTPSSFVMNGIIKFLTNKDDYRAHLLRKYFVFVLVPMLNPDGVSNGHCRMDTLNQNLNRYYKSPDPPKQPTCHSVIQLASHLNKQKRLFLYLDLHAHPAYKGNFIFGNAIFDYIDQVESHVFPKILSQNCINFEFEQCIFSRKHMKAKDRNQDMNKEGCGRVVFYREFGLTHAYTLECGYHCNAYNNVLEPEQNSNRSYIVRYRTNDKNQYIYDNFQQQTQQQNQQILDEYISTLPQKKPSPKPQTYTYKLFKHTPDPLDNPSDSHYTQTTQPCLFTPSIFHNLGRNICISILDIWSRNPYTRILDAGEYRRQIAERHAKLDRFRKEQAGIRGKQKKILQLIETQCYGEWYKRNVFEFNVTDNVKKSQSAIRKVDKSQKPKIPQPRQQISLSSNSRLIVKGSLKLKPTFTRELTFSKQTNFTKQSTKQSKQDRKIQIIQAQIESIKTLSVSEQGQGLTLAQTSIATKLMQLSMERSNQTFKPLGNVRIRNIQLGGNR